MRREPELPRSYEAERGVLGAVLMDNSALSSVLQFVGDDDFAWESHRRILSAMQTMQDRGVPFDLVTLTCELENCKLLERVGGPAYLSSLLDGVPDRPNPEHYSKTIRNHARARRLYHAMAGAMTAILEKESIDDVCGRLDQTILELVYASRVGVVRPMKDIIHSFLSNFHEIQQYQRTCIGLSTSLPDLDAMTTGLRAGDYWIIAGRTGQGKTALAEQMAIANARDGHRVYVASLEMTSEMFIERGISMLTGIAHDGIRDPRFIGVEDRKFIEQTAETLAGWPWVIDEAAGLELHQLIARIRAQVNRGAELVIVDYLQMVRCHEYQKTYDNISAVSAALRDLSKIARVPVVAVCQLRRPLQGKEHGPPTLYDLKESGSIENDASTVLLINRPVDRKTGKFTGKDEVIVAKQRHGRLGKIEVTFVGRKTRFELRCEEGEGNSGQMEIQGVAR